MTVVGHIGPSRASASEGWDVVPALEPLGVLAFTTMRGEGSFALHGAEQVGAVMDRYGQLAERLAPHAARLASAHQVHGDHVEVHDGTWTGWLRHPAADGHVALVPGTALAVTIADCVPVFIAHPAGAVAVVHSGWRGTVANVTGRAIERLVHSGLSASDLVVYCGPSICGSCYEVSPDVFGKLTGRAVPRPTPVDLRALIVDAAHAAGVGSVESSAWCTRCHNDRFFSHRCGDGGRQLAVIVHR